MTSIKLFRGQIWDVNFESQSHKVEPGKLNRPALVIQTNLLNHNGYLTTIILPDTTQIKRDKDYFLFRLALANQPGLIQETDLLIDRIHTISDKRFVGDKPLIRLSEIHLKHIQDALKLLISP